jgi:hypothetical protein
VQRGVQVEHPHLETAHLQDVWKEERGHGVICTVVLTNPYLLWLLVPHRGATCYFFRAVGKVCVKFRDALFPMEC